MMDINEEQISFYSELGRAITQWAHVEFALAWIVAICFEKKHAQTAVDGFLSIENLRSKLQYADTVLVSYDPPEKRKAEWAELSKRAGKLAKKRNRLAHSWVQTDPSRALGRRLMLARTRPARNQGGDNQLDAICLRDIVGFRLEFFALWTALENFADRLLGQEEQFPESQEQPARPPSIHTLRRQIYAFASRPPRPSRK